jgi:hypothetical protein
VVINAEESGQGTEDFQDHAGFHLLDPTHTSFIENSIEAGNLLRGNDALHAMLGARTRARMQLALVTMMFTCLIARLLN